MNLDFNPTVYNDDRDKRPIIKSPQKCVGQKKVVKAQIHRPASDGGGPIYDVPKICKRIDFGTDSILAVDGAGNIIGTPGSCHNASELMDASVSKSVTAACGGGKSPVVGGGSGSPVGAAANGGAMVSESVSTGDGLSNAESGDDTSPSTTSSGGGNNTTPCSVSPGANNAAVEDGSSIGSAETVVLVEEAVKSAGEAAKTSEEVAKTPEENSKSSKTGRSLL